MITPMLEELLTLHEGRKVKMYKCSAGYNTIGVGHNLDANPISQQAVSIILGDDVADAERQLDRHLPWWRGQTPIRRMALIDLTFNMGIGTLLEFKNTLAAWRDGYFDKAADGLVASKWFYQVGHRGPRVVGMVRNEKIDWPV